MREIKFRAWNEENKSMYFVRSLHWFEDQQMVKQGIIMQFTGLKDKNGKEIFESDVVRIDGVGLCRVDYLDHSMKFYLSILIRVWKALKSSFWPRPQSIEVVGNVYENPEVLPPNKEKNERS